MIKPILDADFIPAIIYNREFLARATRPFSIAVEREDGLVYRRDTFLTDSKNDNLFYVERLVKTMLWAAGGWKIMISGDTEVFEYIKDAYTKEGLRAFDVGFMSTVYERDFEVEYLPLEKMPKNTSAPKPEGRHLEGNRIGFDAGGSDMKVAAVVNGETVWSKEIVWLPKVNSDINYHREHIKEAIKLAAEKMESADALGVSTAGVIVKNRPMVSSLFLAVDKEKFGDEVKSVYLDIAKELNIPISVANDGDVAALAASMSLGVDRVLGIAMGTSQAGGYVDRNGNITGWQNELAFAPVDYNTDSAVDEWSHDYGCGVKYFSQDAVIKLAPRAGIELDEGLTPAQKLSYVQELHENGDERAALIFKTIGTYFGYAVANYADIYDLSYVQISGRVTSGKGGTLILENANALLEAEFPEVFNKVKILLPGEYDRRIGQAVAAASLVNLA